ncbi:DUF2808 domain-containing protein [Prochlorococcus marinus]|uniref:DUF2808 domain-containing protein n=1 Tax=Prochlorococcus marinus TaxID=1219 RepID=UPI001ADCC008|nr:DUF2808 domain-containing protein [Prochlorococcus marinus]MBO8221373.1 DUF2808 domain-containing protein [Prochlorococcus marinus CUG1417]MBW3074182.1 hypothetical protein [Prochlorococcus marinus str. MU1417]
MLKNTKKLALNFKILSFFLIPSILVSIPFFSKIQDAKAGLEFQWDQNSGIRRLRWFQKENKKRLRNKIYFFLRPRDRNSELLRINLAIPETFKVKLNTEKISFCNVRIGGFESRTKCLEDIPADIEINTDEAGLRSVDIYPYKPIPTNKKSYAIVLKVFNPRRSGLYQFHLYGQPKGNTGLSYLGSSTIVID